MDGFKYFPKSTDLHFQIIILICLQAFVAVKIMKDDEQVKVETSQYV